jgi:hypothetical protein
MEQTHEMAALQNLISASRLYLNTLDDLARPVVTSYLQNSIDILVVALSPAKKLPKEQDNGSA